MEFTDCEDCVPSSLAGADDAVCDVDCGDGVVDDIEACGLKSTQT